jgi:hypothetical protein
MGNSGSSRGHDASGVVVDRDALLPIASASKLATGLIARRLESVLHGLTS